MRVTSIMTKDPRQVGPDSPVERAIFLMSEFRVRHLPVVEHERVIGVLSERDLLEATGWEPQRYFDAETREPLVARDCMSVPPELVEHDTPIGEACGRMVERKIGCLPVVRDGKLAGMLSEADVLLAFVLAAQRSEPGGIEDPPLARCMTSDPLSIGAEQSIEAALELCHARGLRHLPVVHDGWLVGILSDRDLRLQVGKGASGARTVGDAMTKGIVTLEPKDTLSEAASAMLGHRFSSVPVTDSARLVGIVTSTDVVEHARTVTWAARPQSRA